MESSIHYSLIWELGTICSPVERNGAGGIRKENLAYYGLGALISGSDEINGAIALLYMRHLELRESRSLA